MIKLLLVDDHKIIRDGIRSLLSSSSEIEISGECEDGDEVEAFLKDTPVDVILMDINMKRMNGIDATEYIMKKFPGTRILALSMHNEEVYIAKILKAGALGYILKNTGKEELIEAINKVNGQENYFSKEVSDIMMSKYLKTQKKSNTSKSLITLEELTKREIEILKLIATEMTNTEIGEKLFISSRTVDTHRRNLLQKLQVKNTAGLVRFALENGITE
ncbi:MAG: response regulator [Bacteroidota bacterium]